ncbi:MAG: HU family DNA-binding protein, partial [Paraprevotella sp.]|nr:HU family DNA-binding protein [Paraprevotella sp.]
MDKKILLQDLADGLVRRKGITKKEAEIFIRSVFDIIGEYLQSDKIVKVKGLGTFKLVTVDSRESVDVNTGERIVIKEYTKINFTPDPVLRDAINKPFIQFETVVLYEDTDVAEMERMDLPDLPEETEEENATGSPDENLSSEVLVPEEGEDFVEDSDENGESEDDMSSDVSAAAMGVETEAIDDSEAVADESDSRDMEDEEEPEEEPVAPEEVTPDPSGATVNRNNEEKEQPREEDIAPQEENVEPKEGGVDFSEDDV